MEKWILLIVGCLLGVGCFGYFMLEVKKFLNFHDPKQEETKIDKKTGIKFLVLAAIQGLFTIVSSYGLVQANGWNLELPFHLFLIFGSYIFGTGFSVLVSSFILYYYRPDLAKSQRKFARIATFVSIPLFIIGTILLTEGVAPYMNYPLINAIDVSKGFLEPGQSAEGLSIQWYGILIVSGALVSFFVCDHYFYKKFKKHGLLDSLFLFAFIFGLIGARLWYCLILEPGEFLADPLSIITGIKEGGLAIQGGALLGIIAGVSFVLLFRKYVDIRFAMDVALPSILLAQAIGRFGNFFNQEVYGFATTSESLWFLPTILKENMFISGSYRVPLFFIEALINIGGYFFIRYFLGKVCKFRLGLGYQSAMYLVWYGTVRVCLEPLREGFTLEVGSSEAFGYMQSWITAFAMIAAGLILLTIMIVIHLLRMKHNKEDAFGEKIKHAEN